MWVRALVGKNPTQILTHPIWTHEGSLRIRAGLELRGALGQPEFVALFALLFNSVITK